MSRRWKLRTRPTLLSSRTQLFLLLLIGFIIFRTAEASTGDRLPEFKECVQVCDRENCDPNNDPTPIPLHRRLLFWTCAQECDYTCQHITTNNRINTGKPVTQYHGKWPFVRVLGMQEPFSVLFSLGNLWVHRRGLSKLHANLPPNSPMRKFYTIFAYLGIATWVFSSVFHTRDFRITERLDYFGAGAGVLYGLYYTPVRVFRLDLPTPRRASFLRLWTILCCALYAMHVGYLTLWKWDYTYNMAANLVAGGLHNILWTYFSWRRWKETRQSWTTWPSIFVAWVTLAMSLELLDFPPLWGAVDAHSLWHLGTIGPTILWYNFMVRDSQDLAKTDKAKESKA
ncbi:Per1-like-domain-containing protein [Poronia punctata]|nr:Per1-like-domain-containing protein [Poronia punctata]